MSWWSLPWGQGISTAQAAWRTQHRPVPTQLNGTVDQRLLNTQWSPGQHHYAPLVPGVIKRHLLFTSALPSCTPQSNNPVSSGLWSVEMQKTVQLILFVCFFFIFSCLSFFRQPAEISDAESMKLPMLKVNALTSSLAQNSPSCFVNYFHNIVYFTSSLAWGRDSGAIWLQNLKL